MRRAVALLLVLSAVVAGLWAYGRYLACPPPEWWLRLFLRGGNVACVQR